MLEQEKKNWLKKLDKEIEDLTTDFQQATATAAEANRELQLLSQLANALRKSLEAPAP